MGLARRSLSRLHFANAGTPSSSSAHSTALSTQHHDFNCVISTAERKLHCYGEREASKCLEEICECDGPRGHCSLRFRLDPPVGFWGCQLPCRKFGAQQNSFLHNSTSCLYSSRETLRFCSTNF